MSEDSQIIVAVDISVEEAPERANPVRTWLIAEGIIEQGVSDCVLRSDGGHRPGDNYRVAVQMDDDFFLRLITNGVEFVTGRTVFDAGGNGIELECSSCGTVFKPDDPWIAAVEAWYDGDDRASFPCPSCATPTLLTEWRGPWPWGFGNLGVEFWNWPPLSDAFIRALSDKLGHRAVYVRNHL